MQEISNFITYLNSIYVDFCNTYHKKNCEEKEIVLNFYNYLIDDEKSFLEFQMNYINCEQYADFDLKETFKKYAFSLYHILTFYEYDDDVYEDDDICKTMRDYDINHSAYDELFEEPDNGLAIVDAMFIYLELSTSQKKFIALNLKNDENFEDICENNPFLAAIYCHYSNLEISEEEEIIYKVSQLIEKQDFDDDEEEDYTKVKKELMLDSLTKDFKLNRKIPYIKHVLSIMIQNVYSEIYYAKMNDSRELSSFDNKFFKVISENILTFDEIFDLFKNDNDFSNYIITTFYNVNIDVESFELDARKTVLEDDDLSCKIKKYCID